MYSDREIPFIGVYSAYGQSCCLLKADLLADLRVILTTYRVFFVFFINIYQTALRQQGEEFPKRFFFSSCFLLFYLVGVAGDLFQF